MCQMNLQEKVRHATPMTTTICYHQLELSLLAEAFDLIGLIASKTTCYDRAGLSASRQEEEGAGCHAA